VLGLIDPYWIAESWDGFSVYVASANGNALAVFRRDADTDTLVFRHAVESADVGVPGWTPLSVVVSPDDRYVYVAGYNSRTIAILERDLATGDLTFMHLISGISEMDKPNRIAISPDADGEYLYVPANYANALIAFARDLETGDLSVCDVVQDLPGLGHAAMAAAYGDNVYVVSNGQNGIGVLAWNDTPELIHIQGLINQPSLGGPHTATVSPDGSNLYATAGDDNSIVAFTRDGATGELAYLEAKTEGQADPGGSIRGLLAPSCLAVSPDGRHVYVAGSGSHAVAVFDRAGLICDPRGLFWDGFEYSDPVTEHGWQFIPFGDPAGVYTVTDTVFAGQRSLLMHSWPGQEQRVSHVLDSLTTNIAVEVHMYDNMSTPTDFLHLWVGNGSLDAYVGLKGSFNSSYYSTGTADLSSWQPSSVLRSEGWHKLRFEITPDSIKSLIDDVPVRGMAHMTSIDRMQLMCGNTPNFGTVHFDEFVIWPIPLVSAPDTTSLYATDLSVPVRLTDAGATCIVSAELFLAYDGDILTATAVDGTGTLLTPDWAIEYNIIQGGGTTTDTIRIAMATDDDSITTDGTLINVLLDVADIRHPASSHLTLTHAMLNDGDPAASAIDGSVTLVGSDGNVAAAPDSIIPRQDVVVTLIESDEDRDALAVETFVVRVANGQQAESLTVTETGAHSGVFTGTIGTVYADGASSVSFSGDGIVQTEAGDQVTLCYTDTLDGVGGTVVRCDSVSVYGGSDASLQSTIVAQVGDTVWVRVRDDDLAGTVAVSVENSRPPELESIILSVFSGGVTTSMFGRLLTDGQATGAGDSTLWVARQDTLVTAYEDTLTAPGGAASLAYHTHVTLFGDCDGNGQIQAYDAAKVLWFILTGDPSQFDTLACNLDSDAPLDPFEPFDAALVLQKVVGIIDRFPIQERASANHPQPETGAAPAGKPTALPVALDLLTGDGWVSLWADDRGAIVSGDVLVSGVLAPTSQGPDDGPGARAVMAPALADFLIAADVADDDIHIVFAGAAPATGPGELLRIYTGAGTDRMQLARASFNGGHLIGALDGLAPPAETSLTPERFALAPPVPNPFNPETTIRFVLPVAAQVELAVFDVLGRRVRVLVDEFRVAGDHAAVWDGRDQTAAPAGSGVYFCRLQAHATAGGLGDTQSSYVRTRRMLLLK